MAQMSSSAAVERYQAEARHALERVQHYWAQNDQAQVERWHQAWSLAEEASSAERLEQGGGARLLRRKTPPPLRPLPAEIALIEAPPSLPSVPEPVAQVAPTLQLDTEDDPLPQALARHARIEQALRDGVNPFPDGLDEGEWQYHLTAYRVGGPFDCELLQAAEEAIEAIVEFRPEFGEPEPQEAPEHETVSAAEPFQNAALPDQLRTIYQESLPELTEDALRADLETCLSAGREDTAALIEIELKHRERETAPELGSIERPAFPGHRRPDRVGDDLPNANSPQTVRPSVTSGRGTAGDAAGGNAVAEVVISSRETEPSTQAAKPTRPRRALYNTEPLPPTAAAPAREPCSPPVSQVPAATGYTTAPAWIDAAGRTRTWSLSNPAGERLAEITTRRDAEKLAAFLNSNFRGATPSTRDS